MRALCDHSSTGVDAAVMTSACDMSGTITRVLATHVPFCVRVLCTCMRVPCPCLRAPVRPCGPSSTILQQASTGRFAFPVVYLPARMRARSSGHSQGAQFEAGDSPCRFYRRDFAQRLLHAFLGPDNTQNALCVGMPCPCLSVACPCLRVLCVAVCLPTQTGNTMQTTTKADATRQVPLPSPFTYRHLLPNMSSSQADQRRTQGGSRGANIVA